jgi:hypothetical protein
MLSQRIELFKNEVKRKVKKGVDLDATWLRGALAKFSRGGQNLTTEDAKDAEGAHAKNDLSS